MPRSPDVERGLTRVEEWIEAVAPELPWTTHRGLGDVDPCIEAAMAGRAAREALREDRGSVVVVDDAHGDPVAVTSVAPLMLETEALGTSTARVTDLLSLLEGEDRRRAASEALAGAVARARSTGVELLVLRIDVDDVAALADASARWELSHYRADPRIDPAGAARFYRRWVHNIADGTWCDGVFLAHRGGRVVGIMTDVADRALHDATGIELRRTGWFSTLEPGGGVGVALTQVCAASRYGSGRHRLWETQLRNRPVIRCIEVVECARLVRSAYTLHAWPAS